ncbi:MAG: CBS domain-containing protein [Acidimicrobiales bacterium]|jgi:CBS domain-containing protein
MVEPVAAGETPVSELIEGDVVRVSQDASLIEVAELLAAANIGAVLVGDETRVTAIVSERDVVRAVAERRDPVATRASEVGHDTLVWSDVTATVAEVATEMMDRYVRHVLIEDGGRFVGIVSARDLLGVYATSGDTW